jgi:hypothetical protein
MVGRFASVFWKVRAVNPIGTILVTIALRVISALRNNASGLLTSQSPKLRTTQ